MNILMADLSPKNIPVAYKTGEISATEDQLSDSNSQHKKNQITWIGIHLNLRDNSNN